MTVRALAVALFSVAFVGLVSSARGSLAHAQEVPDNDVVNVGASAPDPVALSSNHVAINFPALPLRIGVPDDENLPESQPTRPRRRSRQERPQRTPRPVLPLLAASPRMQSAQTDDDGSGDATIHRACAMIRADPVFARVRSRIRCETQGSPVISLRGEFDLASLHIHRRDRAFLNEVTRVLGLAYSIERGPIVVDVQGYASARPITCESVARVLQSTPGIARCTGNSIDEVRETCFRYPVRTPTGLEVYFPHGSTTERVGCGVSQPSSAQDGNRVLAAFRAHGIAATVASMFGAWGFGREVAIRQVVSRRPRGITVRQRVADTPTAVDGGQRWFVILISPATHTRREATMLPRA